MASIDYHDENNKIIDGLLALSKESILEAGDVIAAHSGVPSGSASGSALLDTKAPDTTEPSNQPVVVTVPIRVLSDGSYYADTESVLPPKKRSLETPTTPIKKARSAEPVCPSAPARAAPVPRVFALSPVAKQILAGLDQYPDDDHERFPEMFALAQALRNEYAPLGLPRLLSSLVFKVVRLDNTPAETDSYLRQLLLVCFGYGSSSQEARGILKECIRLPNCVNRNAPDGRSGGKKIKSLLGISFPVEVQSRAVNVLRALWRLFEHTAILPTVYLNGKWAYNTYEDCANLNVTL